ncbi:hypothetical protein PHET_02452 [Paragonimus heterotremus]|uniref:Uncharacterized protein n=1 Tax=Paragonimus heterotremus TaxID=100268 RepID=A0A8J4TQ69_9TREM|nr:hypothetical protein PHET_02452 [Paragonimus heterotremus]
MYLIFQSVVFVAALIRRGLPPSDIDFNQASQVEYCVYLRDALELSAKTTSCSEFNKLVSSTGEVVEVRMQFAKTTVYNTQSPSHWYIPSKIAEKLNSNGRPNIYNVRWDRRYKYPDAV